MSPSYLELLKSGELDRRIKEAYDLMKNNCELCPHLCNVNRKEEKGVCGAGENLAVSSYGPHFGEEAPLVGFRGSGTIFLAHCNLKCIFCQNYEISWHGSGKEITTERLAQIMLEVQGMGCHNINFVTPTHFVPHILASLKIAAKHGLKLPLVYNCGGYERVETLKVLDGIIDIYMPDFKYSDGNVSKAYSGVSDYPEKAKLALKEMYRQTGDFVTNARGIAEKGVLVRHLVLPNNLAGTKNVMKFLAEELSTDIFVNVMEQYYPSNKAHEYKEINRRITRKEFKEALEIAKKEGLLS